jgi:CRP-like cAMP-binding protein
MQPLERDVEKLRNIPLFAGLATARLKLIAYTAEVVQFEPGELIVRQGEVASRFYVITSGEVEVVQQVNGQERRLRTLGPGRHFGELALLQNVKRTATVRALTDTTVLAIARQDFTSLVGNMPELQQAVQKEPGAEGG